MSYDINIDNYTVKFKDETSHLEAKLENLKLYSDIPFIGFLRNEMYDEDKCEVESIEPMGTPTMEGGNVSDFWEDSEANPYWNYSTGTGPVLENNIIISNAHINENGDFVAHGNLSQGELVAVSPIGPDSLIDVTNRLDGILADEEKMKEIRNKLKEDKEDKEDIIDNRFEILDI